MDNPYLICKQLDKADLHVHLNGLFSTNLIKEILLEEKTIIPNGFNLEKDLNILNSKHSLRSYLKPWEVLRLMPRKEENLSKLINYAFEIVKTENIKFIELRSSVIYLSFLLNKNLEHSDYFNFCIKLRFS